MASSSRSLLRHGSILSLLTFGSRILGLAREIVKANLLGTSALSDAFSVAFLIPNLFRRLFAEGSISVAFIPTFKAYLIEDDAQKTKEFLSCFFTFLSFFVSVTVALGIFLTPYLVPVFGMVEFDETVLLTRIMFPFLAFISLAALFQGILNSVHIFAPSGFAPVILNIVTIGCAWFLRRFVKNPARAMAAGILIGGFLEAAIQAPFVFKNGFRFSWTGLKKALKNPGTRGVLRLIVPTIIGMAAYQLNDIVSTALARHAGIGIVSSLQYSLRLQELILGVFAVSIGTVLLPDLSEYAKKAQWDLYNTRLSAAIDIIALITIPVIFFSLVEGETIIRLLFQTRTFDEQSVALTKNAFTFHILGLFFIALNRILAPAFYARRDTFSPALAGIISFALNIILAAVLVRPMKGGGIALALSISGVANTIFLFIFLRRKTDEGSGLLIKKPVCYVLKIVLFSVIAIIPVILAGDFFALMAAKLPVTSRFIVLLSSLLAAFLLFFGIGLLLLIATKDPNISALRGMILRRKQSKIRHIPSL